MSSESLETQMLRGDLEIDCPRCGYNLWVRISEVVAQVRVLCPCCHIGITLVDSRGSFATAGRTIQSALNKMFQQLR